MSRVVRMIKCVFHKDTQPSLAIYQDGSYYCFGCHKFGKDSNALGGVTKVYTNASKTVENIDRYLSRYNTHIVRELRARGISPELARQYGIKGHPTKPKVYIPCYDIYGIAAGALVRTWGTQTKYFTIAYQQIPRYSCIFPSLFMSKLWIVESVFDGLSLYKKTGLAGIALLGTHLRDESLFSYLVSSTCYVYFDPDAVFTASALVNRLWLHGIDAVLIDSNKKPTEITGEELSYMFNHEKNIFERDKKNS